MDAVDERRAIEAVLAGERGAFRVLVDRHHRGVLLLMTRLVGNPSDADDLAQQAFVSAFDALGDFDVERRFSTWLYRIAINLAKDHLKSKKRGETALPDGEVTHAAFAGRIGPTDAPAEARELHEQLSGALSQLDFADREIIVLKDIEELSFDEIREITGRPITALKIRAVRARGRLRAALVAAGREAP